MRYPDRVTMCVSSQAGCGMACPFCATGQAGLTRNLSAAEIVAQVVAGARPLAPGRCRAARAGSPTWCSWAWVSRWPTTPACCRRCAGSPSRSPTGSASRSARSPCPPSAWCPPSGGWPAEGLSVTLAVSLHAPDDELRDELVPVNRRWKVAEVLDAAWGYAAGTGRRVSIEYALIRDVNDQPWRADLLGVAAGRAPGARQPDPAEPDARLAVDRLAGPACSASSCAGWAPGCRSRSGTPGAGRSTAPAASWPRRPGREGALGGPRSRPALGGRSLGGLAAWCTGPGRRPSGPGRSPRTPRPAAVRRVRPRVDGGLPDRLAVRRALDRDRRGHADRRPGHAVRGHGAGPGPRPGAGAADRRPVRDRPGQPHRRPPLAA